eukprot:TRINITY_DN4712_c0_g3_i2.p1 TRINITY_DN4712_c0_g3~~TRINITY_DN4712_c0_g3_i2.p1  ORF type:complete len:174 (-),score=20.03 TRINITY_DN4712_c0_g3_i2:70-591(-)
MMKYESVPTHLSLGNTAQSWLITSESGQTLTPREKTENVAWACKPHTPFLPLGDARRSPSYTMIGFIQDESASNDRECNVRSNKPESCRRTCTCDFDRGCACANEPIKSVILHLNFNTLDRSVQLHACDCACDREDSKECEQLEISVKRTFIEAEVKTPNMRRSTSAPSLSAW